MEKVLENEIVAKSLLSSYVALSFTILSTVCSTIGCFVLLLLVKLLFVLLREFACDLPLYLYSYI